MNQQKSKTAPSRKSPRVLRKTTTSKARAVVGPLALKTTAPGLNDPRPVGPGLGPDFFEIMRKEFTVAKFRQYVIDEGIIDADGNLLPPHRPTRRKPTRKPASKSPKSSAK